MPKQTIVKALEEEYGMAALPYHSPTAPFKRSEGRNKAWQILQDAGKRGLTFADWSEKLGAAGVRNPDFYCRFVTRAKRRVVVEKRGDRWVAVAPRKPRQKKAKASE